MADGDVRRLSEEEYDGLEGWERVTTVPNFQGVYVVRMTESDWTVTVSMMEYLRVTPHGAEAANALTAALRGLTEVSDVVQDDTDTWVVSGSGLAGAALVRAVVPVVDEFSPGR